MPTDDKTQPVEKQKSRPRATRRWYQFTLRAMFVWCTIICVLLTVGLRWIAPARRQQAAVQMIERVGGIVRSYSSSQNEDWLTTKLRNWLPYYYFDAVETVNLNGSQITDADLQYLGSLSQLQGLWLEDTQVTDAGLEHLSGLTHLQGLFLDDTQVTNAGMAHLRGLTQLRVLSLYRTHVTRAGAKHVLETVPKCAIYR